MRFTAILAAVLLQVSCAQAQSLAQVTANVSVTGYTIPANFVGLSVETDDLITKGMFQGSTGGNGSYLGVVSLLGANGRFRIGGNSSDSTPTAPALTSGIATNLAIFMATLGSGWELMYGLDMKINNSATAATHAGLIATAMGGGANVIFQFGNEYGGYLGNSAYVTQWNAYYTAVSGAVSGLKVASGDTEDFNSTQVVTPSLTPGVAGMSYLTQHWYGGYNGNPYTVASPQQFLSTTTINYCINALTGGNFLPYTCLNPYVGYDINNVWAAGLGAKQLLSESNSVNNLGLAGYSDRMMSAAWYIKHAITFANMGWAGINMHGTYGSAGIGKYNPIVSTNGGTTYHAAPEFYGLYLFTKVQGQQTVPVAVGGAANVSAIATLRAAGKANILVVNMDAVKGAIITPQQSGAAWSTAQVLLMADADGQACTSSNVVVGGQPIGDGGSWSGAPFSISNGASFSLPPCGAALIQVQ